MGQLFSFTRKNTASPPAEKPLPASMAQPSSELASDGTSTTTHSKPEAATVIPPAKDSATRIATRAGFGAGCYWVSYYKHNNMNKWLLTDFESYREPSMQM